MTETKTPHAGEYWVSDDGSLIRIVGVKLNGGVIYENQAGFSFQFNSMTNWHYEPRCTSFDWVEPQAETWPKYYVGKNWSDADAYVRFDNATDQCVWVSAYGSEETHDETYAYVPDAIRRHSWREITEAEAMARVKPESDPPPFAKPFTNPRSGMGIMKSEPVKSPEPCAMCGDVSCDCDCYKYAIESPDDWVEITNRDHKLRAGIDEFRNSHEWAYVRDSHGKTARQAGFLNVRCRRKDLPALVTCTCPTLDGVPVTGSSCPIHGLPSCELTTAAKRVPVRLWRDKESGQIVATMPDDVYCVGDFAVEVFFDADGFYVTEGAE